MTKAKLFMTGGGQAVRLPAEFRFEGSEVVLSKPTRSWDDYFDWARTLELRSASLTDAYVSASQMPTTPRLNLGSALTVF
jgi:virulence-associated protein VagC